MNLEKESGGSGPRCPTCGSEDVAIRGSQSILTAPALQRGSVRSVALSSATGQRYSRDVLRTSPRTCDPMTRRLRGASRSRSSTFGKRVVTGSGAHSLWRRREHGPAPTIASARCDVLTSGTDGRELCPAAGRQRGQARAVPAPAIERVRRAACDASIGGDERASDSHERGCDDSCE